MDWQTTVLPFKIRFDLDKINRKGIIQILNESNALSDRIKEEIEFDYDSDTRKLYEKIKNDK